jgi:hypothetical protein
VVKLKGGGETVLREEKDEDWSDDEDFEDEE